MLRLGFLLNDKKENQSFYVFMVSGWKTWQSNMPYHWIYKTENDRICFPSLESDSISTQIIATLDLLAFDNLI